jgi:hypothetical protein
MISGTFTGTGAAEHEPPGAGDVSYRFNCSAFTSGPIAYEMAKTNADNIRLLLSGTWVGTVDLQSNSNAGDGWVNTGESYTGNIVQILEQ